MDKDVVLAGWVHDVRVLGGISFILLRDMSGIVQVTAPKAKVSLDIVKEIGTLHQEDVILVKGKVVSSKIAKKGIEVIPEQLEVLNRAETPLPLDPRGVQNTLLETRLNWRFLDFRGEESNAIFKIQSKILQTFREFFANRHYVEIQPPVIIASASEGGAELFSLKYFEKDAYLAQSPQLYKQMCAISVLCSEELDKIAQKLEPLQLPLKRVQYLDAIKLLRENGEDIQPGSDFSKTQEKKLSQLLKEEAFFIIGWPSDQKAFYAMPNQGGKTSRAFDLIYRGLEVASGTQRIHVPDLLIQQLKSKGLNPENFKFYVDSFRYGAPPHAGWSIGLERLTMKMTGRENIRETTMFPRDRNRLSP